MCVCVCVCLCVGVCVCVCLFMCVARAQANVGGADDPASAAMLEQMLSSLTSQFQGMGLGDAGGDGGAGLGEDGMSFMNGMMETLLSKDLMYPALQQVTVKVSPRPCCRRISCTQRCSRTPLRSVPVLAPRRVDVGVYW